MTDLLPSGPWPSRFSTSRTSRPFSKLWALRLRNAAAQFRAVLECLANATTNDQGTIAAFTMTDREQQQLMQRHKGPVSDYFTKYRKHSNRCHMANSISVLGFGLALFWRTAAAYRDTSACHQ